MNNPFSVRPPEDLTAQEIADNFVEMYTDFPKLQEPVNLFIHGPRGAGKSIMLRSLERRVQSLMSEGTKSKVPFFAVHVPIKQVFFGNPEFQRFTGWKATTVGEHLLTVHTTQYLFEALSDNGISVTERTKQSFFNLWEESGGNSDDRDSAMWNSYGDLANFCESENRRVRQYCVRLPEQEDPDLYDGALTALNDFLLVIIRSILSDDTIGTDPICFMIDDADNLPECFQRVLNSWVSSRVAKLACFKVTTQLGYKAYKTVDDRMIESPHDFSEIDIGSVYTSNKGNFSKRIEAIVARRLASEGITKTPAEFFPPDEKQEQRRQVIWNDLLDGKADKHVNLRGAGPTRTRDYAQRYTIPTLMRELSATKSTHTYSYSGLQSLTDLSSGVVRWFLEPASQMYHVVMSTQEEATRGQCVASIPTSVQDAEILSWSKQFREKLNSEPGDIVNQGTGTTLQSMGHDTKSYTKLGNLLDGIGFICRQRVLDNTASEQRLFSISLTDEPNQELAEILHLGVRLGYLQKTDLAPKSTYKGRRPRYILSRRLGPHYQLDVSGYAAHLSVKCDQLAVALSDAKRFVQIRLKAQADEDSQTSIIFENIP